ncbi:Ig domain-containing protein [Thiohalorhabdus sp. Cl-TMA]|uniref:Ig domain-containing protein n=1 Tax=Thiohalorhabdus methylotrophus TaxID=3242694 RepID=A0ABV4TXG1_9GAMM
MIPKTVAISLACFLGLLAQMGNAQAQESLCAQVKIQIEQELTLERQGFDAHMRIKNGLDTDPLENVAVTVRFTDKDGNGVVATSDPDDEDATFFLRTASMDGIDAVDGSGTVMPSSAADIHWRIIPSPGAAGQVSGGKLYFVGATLAYDLAGEHHETDVAPDSITVRPLPLLSLDYFLKRQVYADDPFTDEKEPARPFTLGVRIRNNGNGPAGDVSIDSAQPEIVASEQGLDISFRILESFVQAQPAKPSLLLNFGTIDAGAAKVGRWRMVTDLSGRFTNFSASFSHADELGGAATSIIDTIDTHLLVRDVRVAQPGRDRVRDFLARDGDFLKVFESNGNDNEVTDLSADTAIERTQTDGDIAHHRLTFPAQPGFVYARVDDPYLGEKAIKAVYRSDGKKISARNAWLSQRRNDSQGWNYHLNLFDANTTGTYTVIMKAPDREPVAPKIVPIPDQVTVETEPLAFTVQAADANGDPITLAAASLPAGASFTDHGDGTGTFEWPPVQGQKGDYAIRFQASDGNLTSSLSVGVTVRWIHDRDGDGMKDDWEMEHFGTLDRDGTGDYDNDGISDLEEYKRGMDPTRPPGPSEPVPEAPADGGEAASLTPALTLTNAEHSDLYEVTYEFEVYADAGMTERVAHGLDIPETPDTTAWTVDPALADNTWYHWRARAAGAGQKSEWVTGAFFVNTANEAPVAPAISRPGDNVFVDTFTPVLEVTNSTDVDEDAVAYDFGVYRDVALTDEVVATTGIAEGAQGTTRWTVPTELAENTWYHWRATAVDEHGLATDGPAGRFFVNTRNDAPTQPVLSAPADGAEIPALSAGLTVTNATDPEAEPVSYVFQLDRVATFDTPDRRESGELTEGAGETTAWAVDGLADNTEYFWRAKATDGRADSAWVGGSFFVNRFNDAPTTPTAANPGQGAWMGTLQPTLAVNPASDVDRDALHYEFEVYAPGDEGAMGRRVAAGQSDNESWTVSSEMAESGWFYWRARAVDEHGKASGWMNLVVFYADADGLNDPPVLRMDRVVYRLPPTLWRVWDRLRDEDEGDHDRRFGRVHWDRDHSGRDDGMDDRTRGRSHWRDAPSRALIHWYDRDPDSRADITLQYDRDRNGTGRTVIARNLKEDPDGREDWHIWDLSGLGAGVYYPHAVITDGNSRETVYAPNAVVIGDGGGQPHIRMRAPRGEREKKPGERLIIRWRDLDADSNARIELAYRSMGSDEGETVIASGIPEDRDHRGDLHMWRIPDMEPGKYRIVARIYDGTWQVTDVAPGYLKVEEKEEDPGSHWPWWWSRDDDGEDEEGGRFGWLSD